jgi:ADP-heptose:LPS heptosyltransferase
MLDTDSPRILISRMSAVGDTILTLPVACALRERFPQAFIGWVVEKRAAMVVRHHECVDCVIELDRGWFTSPLSMRRTRSLLRPYGFEFSVDCQSITKSALACWLAGARHRIGCSGKYGCELSPWLNNCLVEPHTAHLTDRSLELLSPLGIHEPRVDWKFPLEASAREQAASMAQQLGLTKGYAVMNPGANWDSRLWEIKRFAAVARHLGDHYGLPTVAVWGNDQEFSWAREIVATSAGHAHLAPPTTLQQLGALIERARLFLSADTGPLHLAVAVGTQSIALHGVTRPEDSGPYGPPHVAIHVEYQELSRRNRKRVDNRAMLKITPELVCQRCDELIAQQDRIAANRESAA